MQGSPTCHPAALLLPRDVGGSDSIKEASKRLPIGWLLSMSAESLEAYLTDNLDKAGADSREEAQVRVDGSRSVR